MPNRRRIPGAGPADATAEVVLVTGDVAERGFCPSGYGMRYSCAAALVQAARISAMS